MNTSQLECCIKCDEVLAPRVIGVFASNRLSMVGVKQSYGLIVNTDKSSDPGQHWCAIYNDGHGHLEFFDSYGRPPKDNSAFIPQWINRRAMTLNFSRKQFQSDHSTVCGLYCILYLHQRLNGTSIDEFVASLSTNLKVNDEYIESIVTSAFPECVSNNVTYNQICILFTSFM